mmetsp:Transcript_38031/g.84963  ORF Transcript_38031/g.84963 Transcript_38031/m.84963 type:complete len:203 (+) Transcript_38031:661-1269(+)
MCARFLYGRALFENNSLPVELLLGSSVSPDDMPTPREHHKKGDRRPLKWLDGERKLAEHHGFGILGALASTRKDIGFVFIDGGAFTGAAEWEALRSSPRLRWVALDDTHAKTTAILLEASTNQNRWRVVYEELDSVGLNVFGGMGYNLHPGIISKDPKGRKQWSRHKGLMGARLARFVRERATDRTFRNFAVLWREPAFVGA